MTTRRSLFIFRRDLRLRDNAALIAASRESEEVIPVFIADSALLDRWQASERRLAFLGDALATLSDSIRSVGGQLHIRAGNPAEVLPSLISEFDVGAVYLNRDYTPYARRRDDNLAAVCRKLGVSVHRYADQLLNEPESVLKKDGTPYSIFTPWYRAAAQLQVADPVMELPGNFAGPTGSADDQSPLSAHLAGAAQLTSRKQLLDDLTHHVEYASERDFPALDGTSRLSAHLRFGTLSIRDVFRHAKDHLPQPETFLRQLYWRDFYHHIAWHNPRVFRGAFREDFNGLPWASDADKFKSWCEGKTGFPIVDAGMRELTQTGYMHNRVRMVVASFLVKNLHINWQTGERFFARHLIDFDPSVNNGNWQWAASTGCDAQPWFRVFNPWRQQKKFDPECEYIRRWIPELADHDAKAIHGLEKDPGIYRAPVVDLAESAAAFKAMVKEHKSRAT